MKVQFNVPSGKTKEEKVKQLLSSISNGSYTSTINQKYMYKTKLVENSFQWGNTFFGAYSKIRRI